MLNTDVIDNRFVFPVHREDKHTETLEFGAGEMFIVRPCKERDGG